MFVPTWVALALSIGTMSTFANPLGGSHIPTAKRHEIRGNPTKKTSAATNCFPALGFSMPSTLPASTAGWWCDPSTEYAFIGFSYEITACQSLAQLTTEFKDIRNTFNGRYVRLYGFCDKKGYYNNVIEAAWEANLGVHALIWFGFDGDDLWKNRRDTLLGILHSNPKAPFVTRALQFGSEPLYDWVLDPPVLAQQVLAAKKNLTGLGIPVTISEMPYGYQEHADDGADQVLAAIDIIDAHILPFFDQQASTASQSWPIIESYLNFFIDNGNGKKIYFTENGWPSVTSEGVQPNSPNAVANVQNEHDFYTLLDQHCLDLKSVPGGGVGWFAHIYSDNQEPGYGIYNTQGSLKFAFSPRTSC